MRFLRFMLGLCALVAFVAGLSIAVAPGGGGDDQGGADQGGGGGGARPCPPPQGGETIAIVEKDDDGKPIIEITPDGKKIPKVKIVQTTPTDADGKPILDFSEYDAGGGGSIYNCELGGGGGDGDGGITSFILPVTGDNVGP